MKKPVFMILAAGLFMFSVSSCETREENTQERIEDSAEEAGDEIEDAAEEVEDETEKAVQ